MRFTRLTMLNEVDESRFRNNTRLSCFRHWTLVTFMHRMILWLVCYYHAIQTEGTSQGLGLADLGICVIDLYLDPWDRLHQ